VNLDAPYDGLARLPRALWRGAVVTAAGRPASRVAHLAVWRAQLMQGELPGAAEHFDDPEAVLALRQEVAALDLPRLSQKSAAGAEQVLRTMCWHLDSLIDRPADQPRAEAIRAMVQSFRLQWQHERADWEALLALLQGFGDTSQLGCEAVAGWLRARPWEQAAKLAAVLQSRPALQALVNQLGRREEPGRDAARAVQPQGPAQGDLIPVRTTLPGAPGELLGLTLGGHLERMTPAEAQLLRHPAGRKLWRARWAEARLAHYDSAAEVIDWRADPAALPRSASPEPRAQRGPILIALDTSASMRGSPETIAKATVLAVMQAAHAQQRACKLLAFGAAGELVEHELALDADGLAALLGLIAQSFDGGTDVQAPIERAIALVRQAQWADADLLIASDGEFGCTPQALGALDMAKAEQGLRVHGLLLGDRETLGLMQVADHIHWVRDWREAVPRGDGRASFSPVHSKSLTALFFPNAMDARAQRHTVKRSG
jgi:VWA domain containing CoxE-like protein